MGNHITSRTISRTISMGNHITPKTGTIYDLDCNFDFGCSIFAKNKYIRLGADPALFHSGARYGEKKRTTNLRGYGGNAPEICFDICCKKKQN